jgi:hypothetical protein
MSTDSLDPSGSPTAAASLLHLDRLETEIAGLADAYAAAAPFPHVVLDDVVRPEVIERCYEEHRALDDGAWANYLHLNERKFANTEPATWGPTLRAVAEELNSARFVDLLVRLTGIEGLEADASMDGGGLHRSQEGGFLNVHADFTVHHEDPGLWRRVNLLLYLNPEWDPSWNGDLELWAPDMSGCVSSVAPLGNRVVVFTTTETSFHGHPDPLRCPPGVARRSLALYYFTRTDDVRVRSTEYRARPGDGLKRVGIYLDKQALRTYDRLKRRFRLSDGGVSRALGAIGRRRSAR